MKNAIHEEEGAVPDCYDSRAGLRAQFASRYAEGTSVLVPDPDIAEIRRP